MTTRGDLPTPRDLVDEVDSELLAARRALVRDDLRVAALEELLETAWRVSRELGRPATLPDLIESASSAPERARRRRLAHALRGEARR